MKLSQVKEHLLEITKCNEVEFNANVVKLYFYGDSYIAKTSISMLYKLIDFFNLRIYDYNTGKNFVTDDQIVVEPHIAQAVVKCFWDIFHRVTFFYLTPTRLKA